MTDEGNVPDLEIIGKEDRPLSNRVEQTPAAAEPVADSNAMVSVSLSKPIDENLGGSRIESSPGETWIDQANSKSDTVSLPTSIEFQLKLIETAISEMPSTDSTEQDATPKVISRSDKHEIRYNQRSKFVNDKKLAVMDISNDRDPMDYILEASLCVLLETLGINHVTESALCELTNWAVRYMNKLFTNLHKISEIQRRRQASKMDLKLLLQQGMFNLEEIAIEKQASMKISKTNKSVIKQIDDEAKKLNSVLDKPADDDILTESDPAFVFFNDISALVSEVSSNAETAKSYIPSWMPPLPPDHTYKATPKYPNVLTDPRKLKEKLVEEGRVGEKALYHIMKLEDNGGVKEMVQLENESFSDLEDEEEDQEQDKEEDKEEEEKDEVPSNGGIVKTEEQETKTLNKEESEVEATAISDGEHLLVNQILDATTREIDPDSKENIPLPSAARETSTVPAAQSTKFDIVEFAAKRMKTLEKRRLEEEQRFESRIASDEAKLGKDLGFYTQNEKLPEKYNEKLNAFYTLKYEEVEKNLIRQKRRREKMLQREELKRQKIEEASAKAQEVGRFEFNEFDEDLDFDMDDVRFEDVDQPHSENTDNVPRSSEGLRKDHVPVSTNPSETIETTDSVEEKPSITPQETVTVIKQEQDGTKQSSSLDMDDADKQIETEDNGKGLERDDEKVEQEPESLHLSIPEPAGNQAETEGISSVHSVNGGESEIEDYEDADLDLEDFE